MTISLEEAKRLVGLADNDQIVWQVREFPLGWCFWAQARRFRETGDILEDALFGGSTHFVIATTAEVVRAGSSGKYQNAEADLLEMAGMGLPLDQLHFETFIRDRLRKDPRFLDAEELSRILSEPDP
jgi:hypothetical protein